MTLRRVKRPHIFGLAVFALLVAWTIEPPAQVPTLYAILTTLGKCIKFDHSSDTNLRDRSSSSCSRDLRKRVDGSFSQLTVCFMFMCSISFARFES